MLLAGGNIRDICAFSSPLSVSLTHFDTHIKCNFDIDSFDMHTYFFSYIVVCLWNSPKIYFRTQTHSNSHIQFIRMLRQLCNQRVAVAEIGNSFHLQLNICWHSYLKLCAFVWEWKRISACRYNFRFISTYTNYHESKWFNCNIDKSKES